jgi:hypothetical protein
MSNFASIELCNTLSRLTKWESDWIYWKRLMDDYDKAKVIHKGAVTTRDGAMVCYAYDLGYMLDKLPKSIQLGNRSGTLCVLFDADGLATADYMQVKGGPGNVYIADSLFDIHADTPEDAVAQLAIKLAEMELLDVNNR